MKIVIDTNIIIAAAIKDSVTRKIIFESDSEFYFPELSLLEIRKHKNLILHKSGLGEERLDELLNKIIGHINIVPEENIKKYLAEAVRIIGSIDINDVVFIATALSISDSVIWSDDGHFEKQNKVKVLKTKDMV